MVQLFHVFDSGDPARTVLESWADLEGKLKTLNFRLKKTGDLKDKVFVEALVTAVVKLKESIEEQKF